MTIIYYFIVICLFMFSVEKASKKLISDTLNLNQSFQMDYYEKYSKYDTTKHINHDDKSKKIT